MILKGSYRERFCMGDSHRCYLYSHSYDASPPEFQGASDYQSGIRGSFRSSERVNGLHSMTKQRIHDHLGTLEIATPDDINEVMAHRFDAYLRDRYRTIKVMKLPQIRFTATGTTVTLAQSPSSGPPVGPELGLYVGPQAGNSRVQRPSRHREICPLRGLRPDAIRCLTLARRFRHRRAANKPGLLSC